MASWTDAVGQGGVGTGLNDISSKLQASNQIMGQLVQVVAALFPRSIGTFTMAAGASKTITDANVTTGSYISLSPTNAAAGTLQGSAKCLYVTAANGSFTVTTASGVAAAGTEALSYAVFNSI